MATANALLIVKTIKSSLEEQLKNKLRIEVDYRPVGVNTKTFFHLYETESWKWKSLYAKEIVCDKLQQYAEQCALVVA